MTILPQLIGASNRDADRRYDARRYGATRPREGGRHSERSPFRMPAVPAETAGVMS
jgi:hypothetical protein